MYIDKKILSFNSRLLSVTSIKLLNMGTGGRVVCVCYNIFIYVHIYLPLLNSFSMY